MAPEIQAAKVVLIGAGKVGYRLGLALHHAGMRIPQVFSRKEENAKQLAYLISSSHTSTLEDIYPQADLYLLAVPDEAIGEVAQRLRKALPPVAQPLVAHTSGATPGSILQEYFQRYGVFYPLQSFSKDRKPEFGRIPFCVYASSKEDLGLLRSIAGLLSSYVYEVDDDQRAHLHLAAVFANNFTNHLFSLSEQILHEAGLPFELLHPLIRETAEKATRHSPADMQTGPAHRGDRSTIEKHLALLETHPRWKQIYELLTREIQGE